MTGSAQRRRSAGNRLPNGWTASTDAFLLSHGAVDPLRYASRWNELVRKDPDAFAAAVGRWLDYYEREGVAGIGIGAVILRGRSGPGWTHGYTAPHRAVGSAGEHILRLFAAADRLDGLADEAELLDERFELVQGHRLDQTLVYRDEYQVTEVTMSLAEGVGLVGRLEPADLPLLFAMTPDQTVRELAADSEVDEPDALAAVRRLYEHGLLECRDS